MSATQITDHADQAVAQLLSEVAKDERLVELVEILCDAVQDAEDLVWSLIADRTVEDADGVQLDAWGRVLGKSRGGLADDVYRRVLAAWQGALRSQGRRNALIIAFAAVLDWTAVMYRDRGVSGHPLFELVGRVSGGPSISAELEAAVLEIVEAASPSGVPSRTVITDDTVPFRFDTAGQGFDQGKMGERILP